LHVSLVRGGGGVGIKLWHEARGATYSGADGAGDAGAGAAHKKVIVDCTVGLAAFGGDIEEAVPGWAFDRDRF